MNSIILLVVLALVGLAGRGGQLSPAGIKTFVGDVVDKSQFILKFREIAQAVDWKGIPSEFALALSALETDYGRGYIFQQTNNLFSLTKRSDWKGPTFKSEKGNPLTFEKYASWGEAMKEWAKWLSSRSHMAPAYAYAVAGNFKAFAAAVQDSGYAGSDLQYAKKLEASKTALDKVA